MLVITPIQDKNFQKKLSEECGIPYEASHMAYSIDIDDVTAGIASFYIKGDCGYISALRLIGDREDTEALEIAGRAILSFLHNIEVRFVSFSPETEAEKYIAKRMYFKDADDKIDLELYFGHHH
jgi:hypothetical protein